MEPILFGVTQALFAIVIGILDSLCHRIQLFIDIRAFPLLFL